VLTLQQQHKEQVNDAMTLAWHAHVRQHYSRTALVTQS
jgi:hypothetical protein